MEIQVGQTRTPHNSGMVLNEDELRRLTGRMRRSAQRRVLTALGIKHKRRPDGSLVVLASQVEIALSSPDKKKMAPDQEPNWEALAPPPP